MFFIETNRAVVHYPHMCSTVGGDSSARTQTNKEYLPTFPSMLLNNLFTCNINCKFKK